MKTFKNFLFLIILITCSNINSFLKSNKVESSNTTQKKLLNKTRFNEDVKGTKNETRSYAKEGGGDNLQTESMRQARIEEMIKETKKYLKDLPKDNNWNLFIKDMAKKVKILINKKNATEDDWELLAYEEKLRSQNLHKNKTAVGTGGDCEKLANRVKKRTILLAHAKNIKKDSFKKIKIYLLSQAKKCRKPKSHRKINAKKPAKKPKHQPKPESNPELALNPLPIIKTNCENNKPSHF